MVAPVISLIIDDLVNVYDQTGREQLLGVYRTIEVRSYVKSKRFKGLWIAGSSDAKRVPMGRSA